jgi:hypothetical protein
MASMNRVQRIGAQAITGAFRTVATAIGEAEASIRTVRKRHAERATKAVGQSPYVASDEPALEARHQSVPENYLPRCRR